MDDRLQQLARQPERFDFFSAVRLLDAAHPGHGVDDHREEHADGAAGATRRVTRRVARNARLAGNRKEFAMRKKRIWATVAVAAALAAGPVAAQQKTIKIGALYPLTGNLAALLTNWGVCN